MRPSQKISRSNLRRMVTHVCMSVGDTSLQPQLPQIFIGNHKCFSPENMASIATEAPPNVQFWRKKSSWNTSELMCEVLKELAKVVEKHPAKQFILALDCASIHITRAVLKTAKDSNIWLLMVPARCTWLLQPLDGFTFSPYKAWLKNIYRASKNPQGHVSDLAMLRIFVRLCKEFLNSRKWELSFLCTGLVGDRTNLSRDLKALRVSAKNKPTKPLLPPPKAVLEGLWPSNRTVPYELLLHAGIHRRKRRLILH